MTTALAEKPQATEPEPDPTAAAYAILNEKINAILNNGDFIPAVAVQDIVREMTKDHPEAHELILADSTYGVYKRKFDTAKGSLRYALAHPKSKGSATAEDMPIFQWPFRVDDDNTERPLGKMRAGDWRFSAKETNLSIKQEKNIAAWKEAMAKKVAAKGPNATTEDVMDAATAERIYRSMVPNAS